MIANILILGPLNVLFGSSFQSSPFQASRDCNFKIYTLYPVYHMLNNSVVLTSIFGNHCYFLFRRLHHLQIGLLTHT